MPAPDYPDVRIESDGTKPWSTKVTVDGVMLPVTKLSWSVDAQDGVTRCELEVPRVALSAQVTEVVAKYSDLNGSFLWFTWQCPCGVSVGYPSIEALTSGFHTPTNHAPGCTTATTSSPVLPVSTED